MATINNSTSYIDRPDFPAGLWLKCKECGEIIAQSALDQNWQVCPSCGYHYPMTTDDRLRLLLDPDTFEERYYKIVSIDALSFANDGSYQKKLDSLRAKTGLREAVRCGDGEIDGIRVSIAVMDFRFMGASMGSAVGERITRLIEHATRHGYPLIIVAASGGARMQEGALSLMQMAKTSAALMRHDEEGYPYFAILTNPTAGGVTASFASLGDVIIAEPKAFIGFAGPRVIKNTTREELPQGFQSAEFLLEHGLIDRVTPRDKLRGEILQLLQTFKKK